MLEFRTAPMDVCVTLLPLDFDRMATGRVVAEGARGHPCEDYRFDGLRLSRRNEVRRA